MILLVQAAATLFMTGLIWFVQVVHYPLYGRVGREEFVGYENEHAALTTLVVAPVMLVELLAAAWLVVDCPEPVPRWTTWLGAGLVAIIWASTAFLQVPAHSALSLGYQPEAHARLVSTNWIRTAAWTARSALCLWMMSRFFR